ncbi:hypothetical protein [Pedobacter sp. UYEF25]
MLLTEAFKSDSFYPEFKSLNIDSLNVKFNQNFSDILKVNEVTLFINQNKSGLNSLKTLIITVDSVSDTQKALKITTIRNAAPSSKYIGNFILTNDKENWKIKYVSSGFYDYRKD